MAILGGILVLVGIILFFIWRSQSNRLISIRSARLSTAADLTQIAEGVAQEIGAGSWKDYVKIRGKIQCDNPLRSQIQQTECVYYQTSVTREYEEVTTQRDDSGNTTQKTERKSETVSKNVQSIPFTLLDSTGKIAVDPSDADIETIRILSEFQPYTEQSGTQLNYGPFSMTLSNPTMGRTIGYRYEESILPIDREALVVGMVTDMTQELTIRKPSDPTQKFILSLKLEEELTKATSKGVQQALYGMIACLTLGIILILIGVVI